jgi:hypothetical protein
MAVTMPCINAPGKNILGLKQISTGAILPDEQPTKWEVCCAAQPADVHPFWMA